MAMWSPNRRAMPGGGSTNCWVNVKPMIACLPFVCRGSNGLATVDPTYVDRMLRDDTSQRSYPCPPPPSSSSLGGTTLTEKPMLTSRSPHRGHTLSSGQSPRTRSA